MKRTTWLLLAVAALVGLAGLRTWLDLREREAAIAADIAPPQPIASIPPLKNQAKYPAGKTIELWGEIVSTMPGAHYYVGAFRTPPTGQSSDQPDVQKGVAASPGLFRMTLPKDAGPVYLMAIADTSTSGPTSFAHTVMYSGNPVLVRHRNIGGIRLEFKAR